MMNKDEAVKKLANVARISVAYAEDLYDSFFEKPVVPQYVADWFEKNNGDFDYNLWEHLTDWEQQTSDDFKSWIDNRENAFQTLVNMHQFGYEVEKEARYTVEVKGIDDEWVFLNCSTPFNAWSFNDDEGTKYIRVAHTRKELENANFGWVFDCPGVEVKEVTDE